MCYPIEVNGKLVHGPKVLELSVFKLVLHSDLQVVSYMAAIVELNVGNETLLEKFIEDRTKLFELPEIYALGKQIV